MLLIKGHNDFSKCEQLTESLDEKALDLIDQLESMGMIVAIHNLPSHIKTPEQYGMLQLDKYLEQFQPQASTLN